MRRHVSFYSSAFASQARGQVPRIPTTQAFRRVASRQCRLRQEFQEASQRWLCPARHGSRNSLHRIRDSLSTREKRRVGRHARIRDFLGRQAQVVAAVKTNNRARHARRREEVARRNLEAARSLCDKLQLHRIRSVIFRAHNGSMRSATSLCTMTVALCRLGIRWNNRARASPRQHRANSK